MRRQEPPTEPQDLSIGAGAWALRTRVKDQATLIPLGHHVMIVYQFQNSLCPLPDPRCGFDRERAAGEQRKAQRGD